VKHEKQANGASQTLPWNQLHKDSSSLGICHLLGQDATNAAGVLGTHTAARLLP